MKRKNVLIFLILGLILIFTFLTRTYNLKDNPAGFFADEASIGINAYTLLTKGEDEHGVKLPIFFKAFGEYKSPIQIYSTVPFLFLFGLNEFSIRFTSVFWSILSIISIFLFSKELFAGYKHADIIGLLSSVLLSLTPWHFHLGRIGFEQMPFVFFTTLATYFFIKSRGKRNILISSILFAISIYTYFPARIFISIFFISLNIIFYKKLIANKKDILIAIIIFLILCIPLIQHSISPSGRQRWEKINIFTYKKSGYNIKNHIVHNYLSHFSYEFLYSKGDIDSK